MRCPKCNAELADGALYCEKCGEDIHIVPDYDPKIDMHIDSALETVADEVEEEYGGRKRKTLSSKEKFPLGELPGRNAKKIRARFYAWVAVLFLLSVAICVLVFYSWRSVSRYNSSSYQVKQAEKYQAIGEYAKAISCFQRAIEIDGENVDLLVRMSDLYFLKNDVSNYESCLKKLISSEQASVEVKRKSREGMIRVLAKKGDFEGINKLLLESDDPYLMDQYQNYLAPDPIFQLPGGTYEGMQSLRIECNGTGTIYYTMDGTIPGENNTVYTLPIVLDFGTVTIRACLINEYGVKSGITQAEYQINRPLEIPQ